MGYKEKLKESQGDEKSFPKITTELNLILKENNGRPAFSFWDKDKEENVYSENPISGVLIGKCMVASIYDDALGMKGGTYRSTYYLTNKDEIALFGNGGKIEVKGTIDELNAFANECTGNLSKKQVLFVMTTNGLIGVTTNITLAIGQFNSFDKDIFSEKEIVLTPKIYDPNDDSITPKTKKFLGKFASINPPKYASISVGKDIEGVDGLEDAIDMFIEWKKYISNGGGVHAEEEIPQPSEDIPPEDDLPF